MKRIFPGVGNRDIDGWSPLIWVVENNAPEMVEALLSTRLVELEQRDLNGRTGTIVGGLNLDIWEL